jgi:dihydrofolate reductase
VTSTLTAGSWQNTRILGPYSAERILELKASLDGDLYVSGSGTLVRAMLRDGLVDELHQFIYPTTRGDGPRLFSEPTEPAAWSEAECASYDNGVVYLRHRR